jgi:hypothetical protein
MILRIIVVIAELVVISKFRYVADKTDTSKHRPLSKKEKKLRRDHQKRTLAISKFNAYL